MPRAMCPEAYAFASCLEAYAQRHLPWYFKPTGGIPNLNKGASRGLLKLPHMNALACNFGKNIATRVDLLKTGRRS